MRWRTPVLLTVAVLQVGCSPQQSAMAPSGAEAERTNLLFWVMTTGGGIIFAGVLLIAALAILGGPGLRHRLSQEVFVKGAGIVFPVVVLTALLVYGLGILRAGHAPDLQQGTHRIAISGEQWWWRITYTDASGRSFASANELHLPVGEPVSLMLTSPDVIHSFWAPQLAGKLDMIPGRTNVLTVTATEEGISRGQCAEYCGGAHAFMSFHVVAHDPADYADWLAAEAGPAQQPGTAAARRGAALFLASGCGGCHTVRGTAADGAIGPDLTHVGARHSLAAATLPNSAAAFADWIVNNQHIKPENQMPPYGIFSETDLADLASYLEGLD